MKNPNAMTGRLTFFPAFHNADGAAGVGADPPRKRSKAVQQPMPHDMAQHSQQQDGFDPARLAQQASACCFGNILSTSVMVRALLGLPLHAWQPHLNIIESC